MTRVSVLGVRHHGPGSARTLLRALDQLAPDCLLIEGPPEADALTALAADPGLVPPVALLSYDVATPSRASVWPFAEFSPEWQALQWGLAHGVPVRWADLPAATVLGLISSREAPAAEAPEEDRAGTAGARHTPDPLVMLAKAAGYDDAEQWWDDVVESRAEGNPFEALVEAFREARDVELQASGGLDAETAAREAAMRQAIRSAWKSGAQHVAFVCGAYHAPALVAPLPPATRDAAVLRGLPKVKVRTTWVPWTHSRLAMTSGYGAGVRSPGWYAHRFANPDASTERWFAAVAGVLRARDLPVSTAHVIEATRLAETLAALHHRPSPGLAEVQEATLSVMCEGNPVWAGWVTHDLVIGERLGEVPESVPTVPLESDLRARARRLRLTFSATSTTRELDLRNASHLERSQLFHQLQAVGIPWAVPAEARSTGTFREMWTLVWRPELSVDLVAAAVWGTTVPSAAAARLEHDAVRATTLRARTALLAQALLADLPSVVPGILALVRDQAAVDADPLQVMQALPPLTRALRYGDVRGTDTEALALTVVELVRLLSVGLPGLVTSLDDAAAQEVHTGLTYVDSATAVLSPEVREEWLDTLTSLLAQRATHPLIAGRAARVLLASSRIAADRVAGLMSRALSHSNAPTAKAAWLEGFLAGSGLLLIHDERLLAIVDRWVTTLSDDAFQEVLPLVRRTFGTFTAGERSQVGALVRRHTPPAELESGGLDPGAWLPGNPPEPAVHHTDWDVDRAAPAVAAAAAMLGLGR